MGAKRQTIAAFEFRTTLQSHLRTMNLFARLAWCLGLLFLLGCSPRETVIVRGNVTFNGNALPAGSIKFFYGDQLPAGVGKVRDGKYELECKPRGLLRVEITAVKELGAANPGDEKTASRIQYLPERYNLKSKLTAEVTQDSKNEFNFELLSDPAK
jgi:hypothetical protein